jgi:hypothetical protein
MYARRCSPVALRWRHAWHAVSMVGGNHASPTDIVSADQEVAFLMPVAGGAGRARLLRFL